MGDSWSTNSLARHWASYSKSIGNKIGDGTVLSGHYDCSENLIVSCGSVSISFAFLAIAIGALVFAVYAVEERRKSFRLPVEPKPDKVVVDKEGWETKATDGKQPKRKKSSNDKVDREQKSDG